MKDGKTEPDDDTIEFGIPADNIIYLDDTNSWVPEMTDEFREMVRKALTRKRSPDTPPASNAG